MLGPAHALEALMLQRALVRLVLLRMAVSRDPEAAIGAVIEQSWRTAAMLIGEDRLQLLLEDDRAMFAELN